MRTETIVESTQSELRLSESQVQSLQRLGRRLASDARWWGSADEGLESRTVIRCEPASSGLHKVRVSDAIGAIGLGGLQITVKPKIPLQHLLFLLRLSEYLPRTADIPAKLEPDEDFFSLVALWFVTECESALRRDLARDYHGTVSDLPTARGRVDSLATTRALLVGRLKVRCSYDSFGNDTALNRLLMHALRAVQRNATFQTKTRLRARRAQARFDDVGEYRPPDLYASTDTRTRHYRDAATLARMLLTSRGTSVLGGPSPGGTFLFRTPDAVEEAIRRLLQGNLAPDWHVEKKGRQLSGAKSRTLNPDLVFNVDMAVGDVKYRMSSGLTRSHINQVTTFAAGYNTTKGLVIGFGPGSERDHVEVGSIRVDSINWDTQQPDPLRSAQDLTAAVREWLSESSTAAATESSTASA